MSLTRGDTWIEFSARAGYWARGVVYAILGGLVVAGGMQSVGNPETKDAISLLLQQPFGVILVFALFVGLCCHIAWRLIQVIFDPGDHFGAFKGFFIRGALLVSAISYSVLALYALSLLNIAIADIEGDGDGSALRDFLNRVIGARYAALLFAAVFSVMAGAHWYKAFSGRYERYFKADKDKMRILHPIIMAGLSARGLVFGVIAWLFFERFLYIAEHNSDEKPGLSDALNYLSELPFGPWIIIGLGVGFMAFALYSFAEGRWRRIGSI